MRDILRILKRRPNLLGLVGLLVIGSYAQSTQIGSQSLAKLSVLNNAGAVSPDGRYWAGPERGTKGIQVMLRDLKTGSQSFIADSQTEQSSSGLRTVFSPDGQSVAYDWADSRPGMERAELRTFSVPNNPGARSRSLVVRPEITSIQPTAWSPDGTQIAVSFSRNGVRALGSVFVKDGSIRTIADDIHVVSRSFFSPDGKYLAIDLPKNDSLEHDIYVLAVDGSGRFPIITSIEDNRVMGWRKDGMLLFTRKGAYHSLWGLRVVDGKPQGDPTRFSERVGELSAGLTTDGRLFYVDVEGGQKVYVAAANFTTERIEATETLVSGNGNRPEWSPDGQHLAYRADNNLIVWTAGTGERREIAGVGTGNVRWAPDNRHLVFIRQPNQFELVVLDWLDNMEEVIATFSQNPVAQLAFPFWAPNSKEIYFQRRGQDNGAYVEFVAFNIMSRSERVLIRRPDLSSLHLSHDGKYIATSLAGNGILLVPTDGTAPKQIATAKSGESVYFTGWSPDSKSAFYWTRVGQQPREIWRVSTEGGEPRKVNFGINMDRIGGPMLLPSPDGSKVAYFTDEGPIVSELRVLDISSIR